MKFIITIITIILVTRCDYKRESSLKCEFHYADDDIKEYLLTTPSGKYFIISIDSIGNLISISNDSTDVFQIVKYNKSNKISNVFQYKNNKLDGRAYFFNENSGFLEGDFNYTNGIKSGNAVLYYDSSAMLKETMLYNDLGELYFREKYDKNGKVIGREGNDGSDSIK